MTGPVGAYYSKGVKPISLSCSTDSIRSAPLGTGAYKIGGYFKNYIEIMGLLFYQLKMYQLENMIKFYGF